MNNPPLGEKSEVHLKEIIGIKKIAIGFYTTRIPMPTSFVKYLGGKLFDFPGVKIVIASNFEGSRYAGLSYCYCIFIFGALRVGLSQSLAVRVSSVFWSYKDTLILLSSIDKLVFRISGPASASLNIKNYGNLQKLSALDNSLFPAPIDKKKIGSVVVSCEGLLENNLADSTLTPRFIFEGLFLLYQQTHSLRLAEDHAAYLSGYYRSQVPTLLRAKFDSVCPKLNFDHEGRAEFFAIGIIHGDLTTRNLAINDSGSVSYFDIDRLEESFPEFDFFMAFIDNELTSSGHRSYKRSLELASQIGSFSRVHDSLDWFYERLPAYAVNKENFELICSLFFVRTVAYILSDSQFDNRIIINEIFD